VRVEAFDAVFAISSSGGTNTRSVSQPLNFDLSFQGPWV